MEIASLVAGTSTAGGPAGPRAPDGLRNSSSVSLAADLQRGFIVRDPEVDSRDRTWSQAARCRQPEARRSRNGSVVQLNERRKLGRDDRGLGRRRRTGDLDGVPTVPAQPDRDAFAILDARLASGEIDMDSYQRLHDLLENRSQVRTEGLR